MLLLTLISTAVSAQLVYSPSNLRNYEVPDVMIVDKYFGSNDSRAVFMILTKRSAVWTVLDEDGQPQGSDYSRRFDYIHNAYRYGEEYVNTLEYDLTIRTTQLQNIPYEFSTYFDYFVRFDASNSNITGIRQSNFASLTLQFLNLSHNHISVLPANVFDEAKSLETVDLSFNSIDTIEEKAFYIDIDTTKSSRTTNGYGYYHTTTTASPLPSVNGIREIHLHHNRLIILPSNMGLKSLAVLTLSHNYLDISYQMDSVFNAPTIDLLEVNDNSNLTAVPIHSTKLIASNTSISNLIVRETSEEIHAENCTISQITITPTMESSEFLLRSLYLSRNRLRNITADIAMLTNLERLDVSYNLIEQLPSDVFAKLSKLRYLIVTHNKLQTIDLAFLPFVSQLQYLNLAYNHLNTFQLQYLAPNLQTLLIDGNGLTTIDTNIHQLAPKLEWIGLHANEWTCQHLTVSLLLLHYDGITQTTATDEVADESTGMQLGDDTKWGRVKGVRCIDPIDNFDEVIAPAISTSLTPQTDDAVVHATFDNIKSDVMSNLEQKWAQMENNTTDAINAKFAEIQAQLNTVSAQMQLIMAAQNKSTT